MRADPSFEAAGVRARRRLLRRVARRAFRPEVIPLEGRRLLAVTLAVGNNVNISRMRDNQAEETIAVDPSDPTGNGNRVYAAAVIGTGGQGGGPGLMSSFSTNAGATWTTSILADGTTPVAMGNELPAACCDGQAAWDQFGNLFLTYVTRSLEQSGTATGSTATTLVDTARHWAMDEWQDPNLRVVITAGPGTNQFARIVSNTADTLTIAPAWPPAPNRPGAGSQYEIIQLPNRDNNKPSSSVIVARSADGGRSFTFQGRLATGQIDQPSIAVGPGSGGAPGSVWVSWNNGAQATAANPNAPDISVSGARVNGPDMVDPFGAAQVVPLSQYGNFGDIKVGPAGQVLVDYQSPQAATPEFQGMVTAAANGPPPPLAVATLTDANKGAAWADNQWAGLRVVITSGAGAGQSLRINSNNANRLVLADAWAPVPDDTSTYLIAPVSTGANTRTTFNDTNAAWVAHQWAGFTVRITSGTATGNAALILDNTRNRLTLAGSGWPLLNVPDATSTYRIENPAGPSSIFVNLDPDGLGAMPFRRPVMVTSTNVGTFLPNPAQYHRKIDAEANLAWDTSGGPFNGRVYIVYTDRANTSTNDTDIFERSSIDNGVNWSARRFVNDGSLKSEFLPAVAVDPNTGVLAASWYDAKDDPGNTKVRIYATVSIDGGVSFQNQVKIGAGLSDVTLADSYQVGTATAAANQAPNTGTLTDTNQNWTGYNWSSFIVTLTSGALRGESHVIASNTANTLTVLNPWTDPTKVVGARYQIVPTYDFDFGDYTGLSFFNGAFFPIWADNSNSTGDNPDGARGQLDIYTARVLVLNPVPAAGAQAVPLASLPAALALIPTTRPAGRALALSLFAGTSVWPVAALAGAPGSVAIPTEMGPASIPTQLDGEGVDQLLAAVNGKLRGPGMHRARPGWLEADDETWLV
jgi:hypothetical protein